MFSQALFLPLCLFLVFPYEDGLIVVLSGGDQVIDDAGQFVGGGCDGLGSAEAGSHTAIEVAQMGFAARQRLGCNAQRMAGTAVGLAGPGRQYLAAAFLVGRAQGKPTGEGSHISEATEIGANFGQQGVRGESADAGDGGQVDSKDSI